MFDSKKRVRQKMIAMLVFFLVLAIGFGTYSWYVYDFNHTQQSSSTGEENGDFSLVIAPRTGQTDSWPKKIEENGETVEYQGSIYDVTINNIGDCVISAWQLKIEIEQDCYINNAWCGKFEIHQNVLKNEVSQVVDLRNYKLDELTLAYKVVDPDLMIPLYKGDYLIYYPDLVSNEYPINYKDPAMISQVVFGIIFYDKGGEQLTFANYEMNYYLQKRYTQSWIFCLLSTCATIWFLLLVVNIAIEINMKKANQRFKQDERIIRQSIGVFTQFFEAKDNYTNGHSQRVANYTKQIAQKLGYSDEECRQMYYIALMHDCGKCYIPDEILKKPGKLTNEEYEIIKSHTVKGAEMLENFTAIEHIREGVLYHHERFDGKGYPEGLKGAEIPLISRIICIADSFDAMNSRRCYRNMLTKDYILSELENNIGKQFDPQMVEVFLKLIQDGEIKFTEEAEKDAKM